MTSRRDLIKAGALAAMAGAVPSWVAFASPVREQDKLAAGSFWPDGVRMVVSVSMQMEGGAQPASGAESPMPKIDPKYPCRRVDLQAVQRDRRRHGRDVSK
jgi:TAT (twin-arginine translocation) pathway signal sequence